MITKDQNCMKRYFKIGEVATLKGISVKTLRYYDEIGLIKPAVVSQETKYRYYTLNQMFDVEIVKYLRGMDVSIEEIKTLLSDGDIYHWTSFLRTLDRQAHAKLREIENNIVKMKKFSEHLLFINKIKELDSFYVCNLENRVICTKPCSCSPASAEAIYEFQELYSQIEANNLMTTYRSGGILEKALDSKDFTYTKIFVDVSLKDACPIDENLSILNEGPYLSINHNGEDFIEQVRKMQDFIHKYDLTPPKIIFEEEAHTDCISYMNILFILQFPLDKNDVAKIPKDIPILKNSLNV